MAEETTPTEEVQEAAAPEEQVDVAALQDRLQKLEFLVGHHNADLNLEEELNLMHPVQDSEGNVTYHRLTPYTTPVAEAPAPMEQSEPTPEPAPTVQAKPQMTVVPTPAQTPAPASTPKEDRSPEALKAKWEALGREQEMGAGIGLDYSTAVL